jgi:hypothetical protein
MKKITIARRHAKVGNWSGSIPETAIKLRETVRGVQIVATTRNYYINTKQGNKLRYQSMSTEGSSAEFYVDLFAEIAPGVFYGGWIATDSNLEWQMNRLAAAANSASESETKTLIDSFLQVA